MLIFGYLQIRISMPIVALVLLFYILQLLIFCILNNFQWELTE